MKEVRKSLEKLSMEIAFKRRTLRRENEMTLCLRGRKPGVNGVPGGPDRDRTKFSPGLVTCHQQGFEEGRGTLGRVLDNQCRGRIAITERRQGNKRREK